VLIPGVGTWTGWLRPVIVGGVIVVGLVSWAVHHFHRAGRTPRWVQEHKAIRKALDELNQFRQGVAALLHPRILGLAIALGTLYLVIAGVGLYVVVRGLGIGHIALPQALAVYFFSLAFSLIVPIPIDIGVLEVSGVGAFIAMGVDRNSAVGAMLINRVHSIGASLAIALIVIAVLHDELRAALQHRAATRREKPARSVASSS
jgi:uncharacterized protein (TIRG00374 family)